MRSISGVARIRQTIARSSSTITQ